MIFLTPVIITSVLIGPALWGGKVFFDSYAVPGQYSTFFSLKNSLNSGAWLPSWIYEWAGGFSIWLLPANFGLLNPLHILLVKFLDFVLAYHILIFIYLVAGFYAAYFLGRALNLSKAASLIVALAYTFNSYNIFWAKLLSFSFLYFLLPFLFLTLLKVYRGERRFITFWAAIFIFLAWPFALPQLFLYSLIATLAFALFLDFARRTEGLVKKRLLAVRSFFYFVIPGTFLALIWLVSVFNFIQLTTRAGGLSLQKSLVGGGIHAWDFIKFVYPSFSVPRIIFEGPTYIGILPLALAIFSIGYFKKDRMVRFFFIGYIFVLAAAFQGSPIWRIFNYIPILNLFRGPTHLSFMGNFFLAVLAGFGLDWLSENKMVLRPNFLKNYVWGLKITVIFGLVSAMATAFAMRFYGAALQKMADNFFAGYLLQFTKHRPLEHYYALIKESFGVFSQKVSFSNPYFLAVLFLLSVVYGLFYFYRQGKLTFNNFKIIAVILTAADLLFVWHGYYKFMPRDLLNPAPAAVFLNSRDKEPFRIYTISEGYLELEKMGHAFSDPEKDLPYRRSRILGFSLNGVSGTQAEFEMLFTRRYIRIQDALTKLDNGRAIESEDISTAEKIKAWQSLQNRNLLSMMNVKYIISSVNFGLPWKKVFETKPVEGENIMTYVYENTEVLPRVYFANNASFAEADEAKAFDALLAIKNFKNATLVECSDCANPGRPDFKDSLEIIESNPGYLKVKTRTLNPRYLVYSESNLPYWEARIDGEKTQLFMANYLYQSVFVPPGEHLVELRYPGPITQFIYSLKNLSKKL